jgi:hypothetical protein
LDPEAAGKVRLVQRPKNRINIDTGFHNRVPPSYRCLLSLGNDSKLASVPEKLVAL